MPNEDFDGWSRRGEESAGVMAPGGTEVEPVCHGDPYEPNDIEDLAADLGFLGQEESPHWSNMALEAVGSVDWYRFFVQTEFDRTFLGVRLDNIQDRSAQVCAFVTCFIGPVEIGCDERELSPDGRIGCCGDGGVAMNYVCQAYGGRANVWLRVQDASSCLRYGLEYSVFPEW